MRSVLPGATLAVVALTTAAGCARSTVSGPVAPDGAQRVLAAEDAHVAAELSRDEAALRRMIDEKFVVNASRGTTSGKEELIRSILTMATVGQAIRERSVLVEGRIAFVFGTADLGFAPPGKTEPVASLRCTAAYVRREEGAVAAARPSDAAARVATAVERDRSRRRTACGNRRLAAMHPSRRGG